MTIVKTQSEELIKSSKMHYSLTSFNSQGLKAVWLCNGVEMQAIVGARRSSISRRNFLSQVRTLLERACQQNSMRVRGKLEAWCMLKIS